MDKRTTWTIIIVAIVIIIGGWLWYASSMNTPASSETPSVTSASETPTTTGGGPSTALGINQEGAGQTNTGQTNVAPVLKTGNDRMLGDHLVAANGMTLYMYTKDAANVSNCTGQCAVNWPPYIVSANEPLMADSGITGKLGTISRADGTTQLTYNGEPLYFWKNDKEAGDTTGQNVGGVWFVVKP